MSRLVLFARVFIKGCQALLRSGRHLTDIIKEKPRGTLIFKIKFCEDIEWKVYSVKRCEGFEHPSRR